jgi:hypothetical protein
MKSISISLICILILYGCNGDHQDKSVVETQTDSINKRKAIGAEMAKGERPDDEQDTPTFAEEMANTLKGYNKVKRIDTLIIDNNDHLQVHMEHYCLHDSTLIVPKSYMSTWGKENAKDFVTHTFATKILILNNKDTIFNKVIKRNDFNGVINDNLKKYAILLDPGFYKFDKTKGWLVFGYSISIPMTDVGVPAYLTIDKKGNYQFWDEYADVKKKF